VDNRPGGGTVIGTDIVAKSPPDGYTLLMVSTSHAANPTLMAKLPFDTLRDFAPVIQAVSNPNLLVVHPSVPARSVKELIAVARARPGEIAYASGGTGSATHLAGELLRLSAGVSMTHVPYKGAKPSDGGPDQRAGVVDVRDDPADAPAREVGQAAGDRGERREALGSPAGACHRRRNRAGLPRRARGTACSRPPGRWPRSSARLNQEMARGLNAPDVRERLAREGTDVVAGSPEAFGNLFRAEVVKWGKVIKAAGIRPE